MLALVVTPLVAISVIGTIGNAIFRAYFLAHHPLALLALDPRTLYLVLLQHRIDPVSYYTVTILRRVIADPCYYILGAWYGAAAISWIRKRSPELGELALMLERWFPRFGWLLIAVYPHPLVMVLAGASSMSLLTYMFWDVLGTIVLVGGVREFGWVVQSPVNGVNHFITRFWIPLTVVSVALFAWTFFRSDKEPVESVGTIERELEGEMEPVTEPEAGSEPDRPAPKHES